MKKALVDFSETTGRYSLLLVNISATALLGCGIVSGVIALGRTIQPLEKPVQRVASAAANIGAIGIAGLIASGAIYLAGGSGRTPVAGRAENKEDDEDVRDVKWEELVQDLWGTEYCLASCKGCKHLVGEVASCAYMVCAMHPYGQKDCNDWEKK
ncbi:hypothetical protein [Allocoleopsis sp.]|uniref:hypothetical protein n=1 Tax=Allocoleopsis sp. TaxID=3088169 RepID=UPI002FD5A2DB